MKALTAIPGFDGRILSDPLVRAAYSEGAGPYRCIPDCVAVPKHTDDLAMLLRHASKAGIPLVPRAAGSGIPGGNLGESTVVDTTLLRSPAPVLIDDKTVRVGASVTWVELDEFLEERDLRFPPDPSSKSFCTLGGMVATNAAGPSSFRFGATRNWVSGIELVTVDGDRAWCRRGRVDPDFPVFERFAQVRSKLNRAGREIRERFPKTTKNSAGYALDCFLESEDAVDLLVGSEGTLAFFTALELKVQPRPRSRGTALVGLSGGNDLGDTVKRIAGVDPSMLELLDATLLAHVRDSHPDLSDLYGVLLTEFEADDRAEVEASLDRLTVEVKGPGIEVHKGVTDAEREALWRVRHAASATLAGLPDERRSIQVIEDGCVPLEVLGDYLDGVKKISKRWTTPVVAFGHAGDGHVHVNALVDSTASDFESRLEGLKEDVTRLLCDLGGTTTGEHGDGRLRTPDLEDLYGPAVCNLFALVKTAFDPKGILNPGVVVPSEQVGDLKYKVGGNPPPIPSTVAEILRRVEREAGWASPLVFLAE